MYSSIDIANELLKLAEEQKKTLTPMQLIKLVFLCHAWMLGLYSRHLIREPIEAWRYGPVIGDLYQKIKHYRSGPVSYPIQTLPHAPIDPIAKNLITQVYERYGVFSGIQLSSLTHQKDSPWEITWSKGRTLIPNDLIEYYYKNLANQ